MKDAITAIGPTLAKAMENLWLQVGCHHIEADSVEVYIKFDVKPIQVIVQFSPRRTPCHT